MPRPPASLASLLLGLFAATIPAIADDGPSPGAPTEEQARFFEAKIRPILVNECGKCHGADKQKAGLRLDSLATILAGGETGPAILPGKPEESLLIQAIRHGDDAPKMPPSKKLGDPIVADLVHWVEIGAPWPGATADASAATGIPAKRKGEFTLTDKDKAHWAFQPIARPEPPAVEDPSRVINPIDAFVVAGLEAKGLTPASPASKATLIRRVTYDLTGLPPSPEEVAAFASDAAPDAYDRLVDRLLASPRYGEKWGRTWLDLVRYAETNSYERDGLKPHAWRYRDYVIRSLNADKPFDRFTREQLAGDELLDRAADSIVATGYYRLGIWDDEPSDRDQARYDGFDDLVATTGQVFLCLTIDCARCHDHKLDPIPQKDYYRFVSFFRNVNHFRNGGPTDEAPIFASEADKQAHEVRAAKARADRDAIRGQMAEIEAAYRSKIGAPVKFDLEEVKYKFYRDTWEKLPDFDALKPETVGTLDRPLFSLAPRSRDEAFGFVFEGTLVVPEDGKYTFHLDSDDGSRLLVDGEPVVARDGIHGEGDAQAGSVDLEEGRHPIRLDYFQQGHGLGLTVAWSGPGFERRSLSGPHRKGGDKPRELSPAAIARKIEVDGAKVLGEPTMARYAELKEKFAAASRSMLPPDRALCVTEAGTTAPPTHLLMRGNPQSPGDEVEPAFLVVLGGEKAVIQSPPPGAKSTGRRLALADWIASPTNPLTPRVLANRLWQGHFGRGIVRSSSNFGLQGDKPTHPELLDWLASEVVAQGWRLKPIHRLIVTSATYRMASTADLKALAADPINDHLWRFDMRRLSAEEIRDSILAVSGNLNLAMYGPGVYPTIPAEVMAGQSNPGQGWGKSSPEEQSRRSVYVHVKRSLITPILESFDVAETDRSTPNRFATTQPTQALAMINGAFLNEQAGILAARVRREAGPVARDRVAGALRLVSSREPTPTEVDRGSTMVGGLIAGGMPADEAFRSFCLVALNLNEFLYLD